MKRLLLVASFLSFASCSHNETVFLATLPSNKTSCDEVSQSMMGDCPLAECDFDSLLQTSPRTLRKINSRRQLDVQDVKNMFCAGLDESTIIGMIKCTDSKFCLTTSDIITLRNMHVSQNIIDAMIASGY